MPGLSDVTADVIHDDTVTDDDRESSRLRQTRDRFPMTFPLTADVGSNDSGVESYQE